MFFGYFKKSTKNQPVVFGREINTDTKNKILSLKRERVFTFDKEAFKNYAHRHPIVIGYGAVAIIAIVMLVSSTTSKATLAYFYPSSCLGGWEYPSNAEGEPSLPVDAKRSEYNEDNSARMRGRSEIYCGSFEGQIPETAQATSFKVAFHISIDDGSVEHIKEEAKKIIDGEDLDADTSSVEDVAQSEDNLEVSDDEGSDLDSVDTVQTEETSAPEPETPVEDVQVEAPAQESPEPEPEPVEPPPSESVGIFRLFTQTVFAEGEIPVEGAESEETVDAEAPVEENSDIVPESTSDTSSVSETEQIIEEPVVEIEETQGVVSDTSPKIDEDTEVAPQVTPADAVLEAFYSLDGAEWISFGYIRMNDWEEARYSIPLTEWNDLSIVQVKLEPLPSFDATPVVYLDSVVIEVEYAGTEEDVLSQPDFRTDTILIDTVVEDIRVIKVLRDGVPMIWYTKLPPPPEIVEVIDIPEIISIEGENVDSDLNVENESVTIEEISEEIPPSLSETEPVVESQVIPELDTPTEEVVDGLTFLEKVGSIFGFELVYAEGESGGDGGGESGSSGSTSSSDSGGESSDSGVSSDSTETTNSENSGSDSDVGTIADSVQNETDQTQESGVSDVEVTGSTEATDESVFEVFIPGSEGIVVDDVVRDNISELPADDAFDLTTTEEIVPGVIAIYYSEEQIQIEISKNLEWNLVAIGDTVDIATPIDISGGKIFWFSRDKTAINEYNTNSGGISSQSVDPEAQIDVKYLEPNGDVSEITIDPVDLEITTPLELETGIQTSAVPDFESTQNVIDTNLETDKLSNPIITQDEIL